MTPCNGCYSTFKECQSHLRTHWRERDTINERLATEDLHYDGDLQVVHFAEWLADEMGAGLIARKATKPFWGMNIAVHYGCHLLRPQPAVRGTTRCTPRRSRRSSPPSARASLTTRPRCSAAAATLDRVGSATARWRSLAASSTTCRTTMSTRWSWCARAASSSSTSTRQRCSATTRDIHIPVLYLSELISLAYGHEPRGARHGHAPRRACSRSSTSGTARTADKARLAEDFDVALLGKCYRCRACKDDCPVCKVDPTFEPDRDDRPPARGDIEEVLADRRAYGSASSATRARSCATPTSAWPRPSASSRNSSLRTARVPSRARRATRRSWTPAGSASPSRARARSSDSTRCLPAEATRCGG